MNIKKYILVLVISFSYALDINWQMQISAENSSDIPITMGYCDECHDGLNYGTEDQVDGEGGLLNQNYTNLYFFNPSWLGIEIGPDYGLTTPFFNQDLKSTHPPEDLLVWEIAGSCDQNIQDSFNLTWEVDSLDADYPIYLYVDGQYPVDMRWFNTRSISCDILPFEYISINNSTSYFKSNIKILLGGCAGELIQSYYQDLDGDNLGAGIPMDFCIGNQPDGWVESNDDVNDNLTCNSNIIDSCGVCDGVGVEEACGCNDTSGLNIDGCCDNIARDCEGTCGGNVEIDGCGECGGSGIAEACDCDDTSGLNQYGCCDSIATDCLGVCGGDAILDECGECNGNGINEGECDCDGNIDDCLGICGGDTVVDYCGDCNGNNTECLDDVFGDGPSDLYAQISSGNNQINLSWSYDDVNEQVMGYKFYRQLENEEYIIIDMISETYSTYHSIDGFSDGIFCITAFDSYDNETSYLCEEASEFSSITIELLDGANLVSFPCIPGDNPSITNIFSAIELYMEDIITEGAASSFTPNDGWIGSISTLDRHKGYWLKLNIEGEPGAMDCNGQSCTSLTITGVGTDYNTIYTLHEGANLISYVGPDGIAIQDAIPDNVEHLFYAIIGQGEATNQTAEGWVGNLTRFYNGNGYWIKVPADTPNFNFIWNSDIVD